MTTNSQFIPAKELQELLDKYQVPGVSIALIQPHSDHSGKYVSTPGQSHVVTQVGGLASVEKKIPVLESTWFELASLSKTLAAAFMIQYFKAKGKDVNTKVNPLFRELGADKFQLTPAKGMPAEWAEEVTLGQLVDHTGCGMHYVNGVPLSKPMPPVLDLISGTDEKPAPYGYANLHLTKQPGTKFGYSGGGFLVLQHLLELMEGKPIAQIMEPFLAASGAAVEMGMSFAQDSPAKYYAVGYKAEGKGPVQDGRLMFPPLAAGALGTSGALAEWLRQLAVAYKDPKGCGSIAHNTAVQMLSPGPDKGSEAFMRARMGLGVFVFEAAAPGQAASKWMLHQAANDGFRGIYLVCFDGPDAENGPRGCIILSNSDNNAMFLNCVVAKRILQSDVAFSPPLKCLDWSLTKSLDDFKLDGMKQEEIVNLGIKDLVLNAFRRPTDERAAKAARTN